MKWKVAELLKKSDKTFFVDEVIELTELVDSRDDLLSISPITVKGEGKLVHGGIDVSLEINCDLELQCAVTLEKVEFTLDIETKEKFVFESSSVIEDEILLNGNVLDLAPIIWQNIIVNIPIKVVSENAKNSMITSGDDWILQSEEEYQAELEDEIDPRLAVLKNFFKEDETKN